MDMNYWLLKTEPSEYSYANLEEEKKAVWDGITNPLALKYIKSMRKGDMTFIYHTGDEKAVVGEAKGPEEVSKGYSSAVRAVGQAGGGLRLESVSGDSLTFRIYLPHVAHGAGAGL